MIDGGVWAWLTRTLGPLYFFTEDCANGTDTHNDSHALQIYGKLENVESLLKPIVVEFSVICIGILFNMWYSMDNIYPSTSTHELCCNSCVHKRDLDQLEERSTDEQRRKYDGDHRGTKQRLDRNLVTVTILSIIACILYIISFMLSTGHFANAKWFTGNVFIWDGIHLALHLPMMFFL